MAIINNPNAYIRPNMKYMKPAAGTPLGDKQIIIRQELDNYLAKLPQKVYPDVDTGIEAANLAAQQAGLKSAGKFNTQTMALSGELRDALDDGFYGKFQGYLNPRDNVNFQRTVASPEQVEEIGKALGTYTGNLAYIPINVKLNNKELLYDGNKFQEELSPLYEAQGNFARNVVDAIDEMPRYQSSSHRGIAIPAETDIAATYKPGMRLSKGQFMSSAYDKEQAEDWAIHAARRDTKLFGTEYKPLNISIEGRNGRLTPHRSEAEIIFQPHTEFEIRSVDPRSRTLYVNDLGTPLDRAVDYQNIGSDRRMGDQGLAGKWISKRPGAVYVGDKGQAHFDIVEENDTAQSFVARPGTALNPYKELSVDEAREAYAKARAAGWNVGHEKTPYHQPF